MIIKTPRTNLRLVQESDLDNFILLDTDPEIRKFFANGILNITQIKSSLIKRINDYKTFGVPTFIIENSEGDFLGRCGFGIIGEQIEVGYLLLKEYQGQGYATEVLRALLEWAKSHIQKKQIIAIASINNTASLNVMKKAGMKPYKIDVWRNIKCQAYIFER